MKDLKDGSKKVKNKSENSNNTEEPKEDSKRNLMEEVFNNEEVRKLIFDHVLQNGKAVSVTDICSCRLVNKFWLHAVSKHFYQSGKPLFQVLLDKTNSVGGSPFVRRNGKQLDNFVSTMTSALHSELEQRAPPFKLKATEDFFRQENFKSLLDCFNRFGRSLIQLEMEFPKNGGSMTFIFPNFSLPTLQSLNVTFRDSTLKPKTKDENMIGSNVHVPNFLQHLFNGCKQLLHFEVSGLYDKLIPSAFEHVILPATITTLNLKNLEITEKQLEMLSRNPLPKLQKLYIGMPIIREDALIFKILSNVRKTLTHLHVEGIYQENPKGPTNLLMPLMEQLHTFDSNSPHLELHSGRCVPLERCVPKLAKLCLHNQTPGMFEKWIENSKFKSVTELIVSLVDNSFAASSDKYYLNFGSEMVQRTVKAFPNIQILEITVCGSEFCGLRKVFQHFKQLRVLRVEVTRSDELLNSDSWNSVLTGIPLEWAVIFNSRRDLWSQIRCSFPSIRDLTELQELDLRTWGSSIQPHLDNSLISDAAFHFAFLQMPKLLKLSFTHRFVVSPEMRHKWESQGRVINYTEHS